MRKEISTPLSTIVSLPDVEAFKKSALYWANHFKVACLLDSNDYSRDKYPSHDWMLAIDAIEDIRCGVTAFDELRRFQKESKETIFGFLSYELKNQLEKLESENVDGLQFPELYFFKPRYILQIKGNKLTVNRNYPETFELIEHIRNVHLPKSADHKSMSLLSRTNRDKYLANVNAIKNQIAKGDFYELNYCVEFYSSHVRVHPVETFIHLNEAAKAPFSSFFKLHDKFLLCASPERFLKKEGSKIISQPIKGTIRKGRTQEENEALKQQLRTDKKEIMENTMIVDLVRNDLSRTSKEGSVKVEEMCGIYEFNTVNQMISTITAEMREDIDFVDVIKNAFPMGSMTGAPKLEVMKSIEHYEDFKRGLYSGSVGYITPEGDFDFNVVIRSIFYNAHDHYLSIRTGGAITADSIAEKEYEEVLLKAEGLMKVLHATLKE